MKRTVLSLAAAVFAFGAVAILSLEGCKPPAGSNGGAGNISSDNVLWRSELFDYAMDTLLNRMDEYYSVERQQQTINRLDQWVRKQKPLEDWQPDPVIAGIAEELRDLGEKVVDLAERIQKLQQGSDIGPVDALPQEFRSAGDRLAQVGARLGLADVLQWASQMVASGKQLEEILAKNAASPDQSAQVLQQAFSQFSAENFGRRGLELLMLSKRIDPTTLEFPTVESRTFQEAVWLRNVASWASGEELDDPVKPAAALFDWVVKNVQLVRDPQLADSNSSVRVLQTPLETLLLGRGTGIDRAWLFVLLARQMNIDAALLGLAGEDNSVQQLWGVGVLNEGEVYLFEPVLGLPVPKPGSLKLTENGLVCEPATLAEAAADEAVLAQFKVLDVDYAIKTQDLRRAVALVEAGPAYLSQRMKMVENRLSGDQKIVLTTDASAQIQRFKQCADIVDARMWPLPYQAIWQEIRLGPERVKWLDQMLRPFVFPSQIPLLWKARNCYFKGEFTGEPSATMFYQAARRSEYSMADAELEAEDAQLWREIKIDASYWLGLMVAQTKNYRAAEDYLQTRVLMADPGGKWEYGATYNLARVKEATGDIPMAIKLYQVHLNSPQTQGNLIRANWLMNLAGLAPEKEATAEKSKEENSPEGKKPAETPDSESREMEAGQEAKPPNAKTEEPETASEKPAKETSPSETEKPAKEPDEGAGKESKPPQEQPVSVGDGKESPEPVN